MTCRGTAHKLKPKVILTFAFISSDNVKELVLLKEL